MMKTIKSFTAVFLAAAMIFSFALPVFAVYEEYPTIYITGAQTNKIYLEGEHISDFDLDLNAVLDEHGDNLLKELAIGLISDDYKEVSKDIYDIVIGLYGDSALDKNGEASNGSMPEFHSSTVDVNKKAGNYDMWDYRFWYDWRLSPMVTGQELRAYIDRVIEATGKSKVNLCGRCYGANVIATYVAMNKDHAEMYVDDIAYYAPSIEGIDFMTAIFTGEISLDPDAVDNFASWYIENENLIKDDAVAGLVIALIELLNQAKVLGFTADKIDLFIDRIKSDLLPPVLRDTFASWPSYWAMVTEGNLEKAIDFIFDGCKDEYAGFIAKVREYYDNVQTGHIDTVKEMMNKGVRYNIFAKYNFPEYPVYEGSTVQSDGDTPLSKQTFGATAADFGEVLSEEYITSISEENKKYLAPDHKIDASTGLLPENTWYIKNLHHNHWEVMHGLTLDIMNNDYNVSQQDVYPQFMDSSNNMAQVTPDEDFEKPRDNIFAGFIRFITAFFNVITKLINGELSLKDISGK